MADDPSGPRSARRPGTARRKIRLDLPRLAAFEVLKAVRVDGAYTNLVLPAVIRHYSFDTRDAAFTTELASGTIRGRGTYDAILAACVDRKLSKVEAKVLDALRLGTHQLLAMRVPDHAAISSTVDLVGYKATSGAASFANAVLRRVSERDLQEWIAQVAPDPGRDPRGYLEVAYSHPRWIVGELERALSAAAPGPVEPTGSVSEPGEIAALLAADNQPPKVTLVARPGRATREELGGEPTAYSRWGAVLESGRPTDVPAVVQGRAGVQDEGSQLVAEALAAAPLEGADRVWLDLCAGPGGKSALLAGLAAQRGAGLIAIEKAPHRAGLVRQALAGSEGVLGILTADGTAAPIAPGSVDRVLVDAPCTGLGALRRRPEARWRRSADDLLELVLLQRQLLDSAVDLVRPGGVVLYATCSPVHAETSGVVTSILQSRREVHLDTDVDLLPGVPDCAAEIPGSVQLWPHRHGTDAMFLALFRKDA